VWLHFRLHLSIHAALLQSVYFPKPNTARQMTDLSVLIRAAAPIGLQGPSIRRTDGGQNAITRLRVSDIPCRGERLTHARRRVQLIGDVSAVVGPAEDTDVTLADESSPCNSSTYVLPMLRHLDRAWAGLNLA
jgi:hypothetical protein